MVRQMALCVVKGRLLLMGKPWIVVVHGMWRLRV
jgi:hypothetical protein